MEDLIKTYLDDYSKSTASVPLKLKYVDLIDSFTVKQLRPMLDSNRQNIFVAASLDDNFNRRLINQFALAGKSYKISIIGMPIILAILWLVDFFRMPAISFNCTVSSPSTMAESSNALRISVVYSSS